MEPSQVATNTDAGRVSAAEVAKLLNVSPAYVRKLATAGKLGDVGSAATGETMFELRAVQAYRQEQKRRKRKGLAKMVDAVEEAGLYDREIEAPKRKRLSAPHRTEPP